MAAPTTLSFVDNPLSSRTRFRCRGLSNWLFAFLLFAAWVCIVMPFWFRWLADIAGIALLSYMLFFVWEKRPIKMRCPHCRKLLLSNTPWICGFCGKKNEHVDKFPFVHKCEHCHAEPKAYRCHHRDCSGIMFLTEERVEDNCAIFANLPPAPPVEDDIILHYKEKEKLMHELEITELAIKIDASKQRLEFGKKKSPLEEIQASFAKYDGRVMGSEEFARQQRLAYAEKYKDDPEMLERANATLAAWLIRQT